MIARIVSALCLIALPVTVRAQVLWQKATYGMSPAEVAEAVPGSKPPTEPIKMSGSVELLRLEDFALVSRSFDVRFLFKDQRLVQVMLSLKQTKSDSYHSYSAVFDSLTDSLRAKYGVELSKSRKEVGGFRMVQSEWISGKTGVGILLMDSYGALALNVNYDFRISKEAEKL